MKPAAVTRPVFYLRASNIPKQKSPAQGRAFE
jgi:hypothetical protein